MPPSQHALLFQPSNRPWWAMWDSVGVQYQHTKSYVCFNQIQKKEHRSPNMSFKKLIYNLGVGGRGQCEKIILTEEV